MTARLHGRVRDYRLTAHNRRFAHALRRFGLGCHAERVQLQPWESGQDHVALYLHNGNEFLEAMYGAYKARAVAVNINYRYVEDDLEYVLANSSARAIVYHAVFAPKLAAVRKRLPKLEHVIQVRADSGKPLLDGAVEYEDLLAAQRGDPVRLPYTTDDLYIFYTGGTTGMPKGVLWRQEDVFYNGLAGGTSRDSTGSRPRRSSSSTSTSLSGAVSWSVCRSCMGPVSGRRSTASIAGVPWCFPTRPGISMRTPSGVPSNVTAPTR